MPLFPAYAANECGAAVSGDTVTCNGDGNPASDSGTYAGISYSVPVTLNLDGTVNPLTITGITTIVSNAGPQTYNLTGTINIICTGSPGIQNLGDYNFHARDETINIGQDVTIGVTRTTANGNVYAVAAGASNGALLVNNGGNIQLSHTGGGGSSFLAGITASAATGGANTSVNVTNTGSIDVNMVQGYYAYIIYAGASSAGSTSAVTVNNSGTVNMTQSGGNAGCSGLAAINFGTGGAIINHSGTLTMSGDCPIGMVGINNATTLGNTVVNIDGTVDVTSNIGYAAGTYAYSTTASSIFNVNADIIASGPSAIGIWNPSNGSSYDINIANGASIRSTGASAVGIYALAANGGTIDIAAGTSIYTDQNGSVGSAIISGDGNDVITSYGDITGDIETALGSDTLSLLGGSMSGGIDMGGGDDNTTIDGLATADIAGITHLLGGAGTDELTLSNLTHAGGTLTADDIANGINLGDGWETINFNNTNWTLTGNLTLGGSTVNINPGSTLYAGNGINSVISSVIPGDPATVNNNGTIDLSNGPYSTNDTLTIFGNYVGNGALIVDASASGGIQSADTLIIDGSNGGGSATGTTTLYVSNNSLGGSTTGNGVLVVNAINGATTAANAFVLAPGNLVAGAYRYDLNAIGNDYYLSAILRNEVPVDMALSGMAYQYGIGMLGTKDQRMPIDSAYHDYAFWMRSFAEKGNDGNDGNFAAHGPYYDYDMAGVQLGLDLYREEISKNHGSHVTGIYAGAATMGADVMQDTGTGLAGTADMNGYSLGAYWTYHGANDYWYVDNVLQGTYYSDAKTLSVDGEGINTEGLGIAASSEAGINMHLGNNIDLTPQAQLVYQAIRLNDASNTAGNVSFDTARAFSARIGSKVSRTWASNDGHDTTLWVTPNIWHRFADSSTTHFGNTAGTSSSAFDNDLGGTWGQLEFGASHIVRPGISLFAAGNYGVSLDRDGSSIAGRVGVKWAW